MPRRYSSTTTTKRKTTGFKKKVYKKNGYSMSKTVGAYGGIERKFFDTHSTTQALSTSWAPLSPTTPAAVLCLSAPAQGTEENEHIGRTFFINSIFVRGTMRMSAVDLGAIRDDVDWRVILVWDMQTNGTTIVAADVIDEVGAVDDVIAYRNLQNSSRFIVLGDTGRRIFKTPNVATGNAATFNQPETRFQFSFAKTFTKAIKVRTDGLTAVIGSITDNSFSLIGISSVASSVGIAFETRMRFSEQSI